MHVLSSSHPALVSWPRSARNDHIICSLQGKLLAMKASREKLPMNSRASLLRMGTCILRSVHAIRESGGTVFVRKLVLKCCGFGRWICVEGKGVCGFQSPFALLQRCS